MPEDEGSLLSFLRAKPLLARLVESFEAAELDWNFLEEYTLGTDGHRRLADELTSDLGVTPPLQAIPARQLISEAKKRKRSETTFHTPPAMNSAGSSLERDVGSVPLTGETTASGSQVTGSSVRPESLESPDTVNKRKAEDKERRVKEKDAKELDLNLQCYKKKVKLALEGEVLATEEEAVEHCMSVLEATLKYEVCTLSKPRRRSPGGLMPPVEDSEAKVASKSAGDQYFW